MEKRYLSSKELAVYLAVSVNTVRSWVWLRKIPHNKLNGLIRFDLREIETWLKHRKVKEIA
jgi:excisionase family DNA binding protein